MHLQSADAQRVERKAKDRRVAGSILTARGVSTLLLELDTSRCLISTGSKLKRGNCPDISKKMLTGTRSIYVIA